MPSPDSHAEGRRLVPYQELWGARQNDYPVSMRWEYQIAGCLPTAIEMLAFLTIFGLVRNPAELAVLEATERHRE
jgi:hypothetical protein